MDECYVVASVFYIVNRYGLGNIRRKGCWLLKMRHSVGCALVVGTGIGTGTGTGTGSQEVA
jgi:hypothetical protein